MEAHRSFTSFEVPMALLYYYVLSILMSFVQVKRFLAKNGTEVIELLCGSVSSSGKITTLKGC